MLTVIHFVTLFAVHGSTTDMKFVHYVLEEGYKSFVIPQKIKLDSSITDCAAECSLMPSCKGSNFHSLSKMCYLHDDMDPDKTIDRDWTSMTWCLPLIPRVKADNQNLLGFWPLTESMGLNDYGPFNLIGNTGSTSFSSTTDCFSPFRPLSFHGEFSYLRYEHQNKLKLSSSEFTWTCWFQPLDFNYGPLFNFYRYPENYGSYITYVNNKLFVALYDSANGILMPTFLTQTTLTVGKWNRLGVSFDGSLGKITTMVNGVIEETFESQWLNIIPKSDGEIFMGSR